MRIGPHLVSAHFAEDELSRMRLRPRIGDTLDQPCYCHELQGTFREWLEQTSVEEFERLLGATVAKSQPARDTIAQSRSQEPRYINLRLSLLPVATNIR